MARSVTASSMSEPIRDHTGLLDRHVLNISLSLKFCLRCHSALVADSASSSVGLRRLRRSGA